MMKRKEKMRRKMVRNKKKDKMMKMINELG